jgi:hypothetical protein
MTTKHVRYASRRLYFVHPSLQFPQVLVNSAFNKRLNDRFTTVKMLSIRMYPSTTWKAQR